MRNTSKRSGLEDSMLRGMREAVAFERGELKGVRIARVPVTARRATAVPAPALARSDIVKLRERLGLSQPIFARVLNVSPETVRAWEQGKREPDGAALRLLEVAGDHPDWLLEKVKATIGVQKPKRRASSSG